MRKISSLAVQMAVNKQYNTKFGWPLYPMADVEHALRNAKLISNDEIPHCFEPRDDTLIINQSKDIWLLSAYSTIPWHRRKLIDLFLYLHRV